MLVLILGKLRYCNDLSLVTTPQGASFYAVQTARCTACKFSNFRLGLLYLPQGPPGITWTHSCVNDCWRWSRLLVIVRQQTFEFTSTVTKQTWHRKQTGSEGHLYSNVLVWSTTSTPTQFATEVPSAHTSTNWPVVRKCTTIHDPRGQTHIDGTSDPTRSKSKFAKWKQTAHPFQNLRRLQTHRQPSWNIHDKSDMSRVVDWRKSILTDGGKVFKPGWKFSQ